MANIDRGIVHFTGPGVIGGGVSILYATPGGSVMAAIRTMFESVKSSLPDNLTISYDVSGDTLDDATGHLTGSWSTGALTPTVGTFSGRYNSAGGACIAWSTNTVVPAHGSKPPRKLRGRTFVVPISAAAMDTDGTLDSSFRSTLQASANTLISSTTPHLVVWHRPTTSGGTDGTSGAVISASVRDKCAILTSRRD